MLSSAPPTSFLGHYEALVASGAIEPDAGMEEQKRPTAPFFDGLNLDAVDRYGGRRIQ